MNYKLIKDLVQMAEDFDAAQAGKSVKNDIEAFKKWICNDSKSAVTSFALDWEGKENGRSPESVISTMLVHLNRYAKNYSKSAIHGSGFSTQDDFIYLINLQSFGAMTKAEIIKRNVHDKTSGMQIINRLIKGGWVEQIDSETDKRSKVISITDKGAELLKQQMQKIRVATNIVSGNLSYDEKIELIRLLSKLDVFHREIFNKNFGTQTLLNKVEEYYLPVKHN